MFFKKKDEQIIGWLPVQKPIFGLTDLDSVGKNSLQEVEREVEGILYGTSIVKVEFVLTDRERVLAKNNTPVYYLRLRFSNGSVFRLDLQDRFWWKSRTNELWVNNQVYEIKRPRYGIFAFLKIKIKQMLGIEESITDVLERLKSEGHEL
ncbi:hypothetical protein [Leptospira wolffii]|uniref:hypothetical protein n=1 Tax=Leptospira wolffii TaxID=409998 RepID=UPI00058B5851|nr:hypothetical protein [Leptospira wolffii]